MAKLTMSKIMVAAAKGDRKAILEHIQRYGLVEPYDLEKEETFQQVDTESQVTLFDRNVQAAEQALEVLNAHIPEKKPLWQALNGRRTISVDEYAAQQQQVRATYSAVSDLLSLSQQQNECKAEVVRLTTQLAELEPWLSLDLSPSLKKTGYTAWFFGSVSYQAEESDFLLQLQQTISQQNPEMNLEEPVPIGVQILSQSTELTCMSVIAMLSDAPQVEQALRGLGFTRPNHLSKELPKEKYQRLSQRRSAITEEIQLISQLICDFAPQRDDIRFLADYYRMRAEKYRLLGRLWQGKNVFLLTGYVPERYAGPLKKALEYEYAAAVEIEPVDEKEEAPVMLENSPFASPVSSITEMYSMPSKEDIDPTCLMSLFFYLFFGIMLSDAGYGILMVVVCLLVLKKFDLEPKMYRNIKMFLYCGISTTFWGFMFGGFFGDLISSFSKAFLGKEVVLNPIWLNPIKEPMTMLIFGVVLGVIQIFVGMGAKFYLTWKSGHPLDALLDIGSWYLIIGGACALLAGNVMGLGTIGMIGMVCFLSGLGLVLVFGGRKSSHIFGKIFGGIPKLYDITSYASDILSYSRLMALGLATGVIAQVFNLLGTMLSGIPGLITFFLVFLIGHGINLGINALGAYVHTIRLQYVEFFSKFYEGGGRPFQPFQANTKYIRFKEETNK